MKISRQEAPFKPIIITLETREETRLMLQQVEQTLVVSHYEPLLKFSSALYTNLEKEFIK